MPGRPCEYQVIRFSDLESTMKLINRLGYCLAAGLPLIALAACSGGDGTSGPPPEVSSIVLDTVPTGDTAGIYIAEDDGLFARQGLNVKIVLVGGAGNGLGDLQTGKAQLIEGNYVSFILAQIAGRFAAPDPADAAATEPLRPVDIRIIADTSQMQPGNQALYVMPDSPYKTVPDLVRDHATVGVNQLHNIGTLLLGSLLASFGYPVTAVRQVPDALTQLPRLLARHKISAAWLPDPFGTEAEQEYGAVPLADFDQGSLQNFPIGTVAGNASWVREHPRTVAAFLHAFQEGQQIADTNRAAAEQALLTNRVVPSKIVAATMTLPTYPLTMDVPEMQRVPDAMYEFGIIDRRYDITSMIQPENGEVG
jgi:NitT/TauT family transport system substrate-binding protein